MSRRTLPILKQLISRSKSDHRRHFDFVLRSDLNKRSITYMPRPGDGTPRAVTLIPGDGIGPLVTGAVEQVMEAIHAPVFFEQFEVHGNMKKMPQEVIDSIRKNKVCLSVKVAVKNGQGLALSVKVAVKNMMLL